MLYLTGTTPNLFQDWVLLPLKNKIETLMIYSKTKTSAQKGFTLAEVTITAIIVGVLAGLSLPKIGYTIERTRISEAFTALTALRQAQELYKFENSAYTATYADLEVTVDTLVNFDNIVVSTIDPIASIDRQTTTQSTYDYTLSIDADGTITCAGTTPANICIILACNRGAGDECN